MEPQGSRLPCNQTERFLFRVTHDHRGDPSDGDARAVECCTKIEDHGELGRVHKASCSDFHRFGQGIPPLLHWFTTYQSASAACFRLRATGRTGVRMIVIWAEGMVLFRTDNKCLLNSKFCSANQPDYTLRGPKEERSQIVLQFNWMHQIVCAPDRSSRFVLVPKHVLDQRSADGDADVYGKLERGLLEEMYEMTGRLELGKRDALLRVMSSSRSE